MVEEMFDNIAPTYDTLNHRLSWDIDKGWRKKAIRRLAPFSPKNARHRYRYRRFRHPSRTDATSRPADRSRHLGRHDGDRQTEGKATGTGNTISFAKEDCLNLSFQDESFDAVTAAFGIRNFQNLDQGLKEMCRVLKKADISAS